MVLPTIKQKPINNNPKFFVYFGKPKSGDNTTNIAVYMRNRIDNYRANTGNAEMRIPW